MKTCPVLDHFATSGLFHAPSSKFLKINSPVSLLSLTCMKVLLLIHSNLLSRHLEWVYFGHHRIEGTPSKSGTFSFRKLSSVRKLLAQSQSLTVSDAAEMGPSCKMGRVFHLARSWSPKRLRESFKFNHCILYICYVNLPFRPCCCFHKGFRWHYDVCWQISFLDLLRSFLCSILNG